MTGGSAPHEVGSIHCCRPGATTVTVALPLVSGFDPASIFLCCIGVSRLRCTVTVLYCYASEPCGDAPTPLIVPAFGQMLLIFPIITYFMLNTTLSGILDIAHCHPRLRLITCSPS